MNRRFLVLILFWYLACIPVLAQDSIPKKYYSNFDTSWTAEVPIWIPGLRGNLSYGRINTENPEQEEDIDLKRVDSNSGLEFYFNGSLAKRINRFWFSIDAFSGKIGSRFSYIPTEGTTQIEFVDITVSGTSPRLTAGFSVFKSKDDKELVFELIPYTGLRYSNFRLKSDIFNNSDVIDLNPNWVEPIFGLYVPIYFKRFRLELQGDYGWRNSSNSTVAFHTRLRYRFSRLIDMALGIATMDYDYVDTIDDERLVFDIRLVGPTLSLSFNF